MNSLQHHGQTSQLAINCHDQRTRIRKKRFSVPGCCVDIRNAKLMDMKRSVAVNIRRLQTRMDGTCRYLSAVTTCRRRALSADGSQPCSNYETDACDTEEMDPCDTDEKFSQETGQLERIKESILKSTRSLGNLTNYGDFQSELLFLALPAIVGQAIDPLALLAETAYIGRLGAVELASAGVSVTIFNIISKLFNVPLLSITTSFVAEDISKNASRHGVSDGCLQVAKAEDKANGNVVEKQQLPSVSTALLLAVGIGAFEALALFWGSGQFLNMMGVGPASPMHNPAKSFLSLRALGAPANVLSLAIQGIFRGFKDTQTPLYCIGIGNLSAIVLLPLLVYTLRLGLFGAAIATVASQYIATALLLGSLSRRAVILPPRIKDLQFDGYIKSGGLLLGRTLSVLITMTLGTSMAARQGPLAMAAHQICMQVWLAVSLLSDALALSAQALIASSFAKFEYQRVKNITYYVLKIGIVSGIALAVILGASFGSLAKLFTRDEEVLQIVKTGVLFVSATQPLNALAFIFDGLHYGVSDFSYAACSMMAVGAASCALLLYAPPKCGLPGVWAGLTLFMFLRMAAGIIRLQWRSGPWRFLWQDPQIYQVAN